MKRDSAAGTERKIAEKQKVPLPARKKQTVYFAVNYEKQQIHYMGESIVQFFLQKRTGRAGCFSGGKHTWTQKLPRPSFSPSNPPLLLLRSPPSFSSHHTPQWANHLIQDPRSLSSRQPHTCTFVLTGKQRNVLEYFFEIS